MQWLLQDEQGELCRIFATTNPITAMNATVAGHAGSTPILHNRAGDGWSLVIDLSTAPSAGSRLAKLHYKIIVLGRKGLEKGGILPTHTGLSDRVCSMGKCGKPWTIKWAEQVDKSATQCKKGKCQSCYTKAMVKKRHHS